jgi:putative glutamine amidotransferase
MTPLQPRIAIPEPTSTDPAYNQRSLPQYIRAVEEAGGLAVTIPLRATIAEQAAVLAGCSAILLPGSPADVDPARYGQQPVKECAPMDAAREACDDFLLRAAFEQGRPLLGICYGLQSLNVWRHGTLVQHLPPQDLPHQDLPHQDLPQQDLPHAPEPAEPDRAARLEVVNHEPGREVLHAHQVHVAPGSQLSRILSAVPEDGVSPAAYLVNSSHHQAIDRPGELLRVAATSPGDGVIEALEGVDPQQFLVAVQWHPERSYEHSAASRALFAAFLDAARRWEAAGWWAAETGSARP